MMRRIFDWILQSFPSLRFEMRWNQPMFVDHGTFIIGFSTAKDHLSVSPEAAGIAHFSQEIRAAGYSQTKNLFRIGWDQPVDYNLLEEIITFNIADKAAHTTFWRA